MLLTANGIAGEAYNCYDMYIADHDVAQFAKQITGSSSRIEMKNEGPKHQIETTKIRSLGMTFGGPKLLEQTIAELVNVARQKHETAPPRHQLD